MILSLHIHVRSLWIERYGAYLAPLISFLIPSIIRWIPETQFPYPIGFDTPLYMAWGRHYASNPSAFPIMLPLLGGLYALGFDLSIVMKILPTILYGLLGLAAYRFSRLSLGWSPRKGIIAVALITLSLASLRASWDMHKQTMAIVFLLLALSFKESSCEALGLAGFVLSSLLSALSHELVFTILFTILLYRIFLGARKGFFQVLPNLSVALGSLLLFLGAWYGWRWEFVICTGAGGLTSDVSLATWSWEASKNLLEFFQLYALTLPIVIIGVFKDRNLLPWSFLCLLGSFSPAILPVHRPGIVPSRWMILLSYPFSLYGANGLERLLTLVPLSRKGRIALIWKYLVLFLSILSANIPSLGFLGFFPQPPQFTIPGLLPERMASSSIPLPDIEATICLTRFFDRMPGSVILVHGNYVGWVSYYTDKKIITFGELYGENRTIPQSIQIAINEGYDGQNRSKTIYLLWYGDQDAHESGFIKVVEMGSLRLYIHGD